MPDHYTLWGLTAEDVRVLNAAVYLLMNESAWYGRVVRGPLPRLKKLTQRMLMEERNRREMEAICGDEAE